jgi:hypothetical protein
VYLINENHHPIVSSIIAITDGIYGEELSSGIVRDKQLQRQMTKNDEISLFIKQQKQYIVKEIIDKYQVILIYYILYYKLYLLYTITYIITIYNYYFYYYYYYIR